MENLPPKKLGSVGKIKRNSLKTYGWLEKNKIFFLYYRQWKVNNRHVSVSTGMSHHLSNWFLCGSCSFMGIRQKMQFASITTWKSPFCCIRKSHTQSCMSNHADMFSTFCRIHITHRLYHVSAEDNTLPI